MKKDYEANQEGGLRLKNASVVIIIAACIAAIALFISDSMVTQGYRRMEAASERYISAKQAAMDLESASDYLTDRVRCFVVTKQIEYLEDYFEEADVIRRRDTALEELESLLEGNDNSAYHNLSRALDYSNTLMDREYLAMRLILASGSYSEAVMMNLPDPVQPDLLEKEDLALTPEEQRIRAQSLVFDAEYMEYKERISGNVTACTEDLIEDTSKELAMASGRMDILLRVQTFLTILFLVIVFVIVYFITTEIRQPLTRMVELMREQKIVPSSGAAELRFVTRTYNEILTENKEHQEKLAYEATHDPLTGLYNRGAYEMFMRTIDTDHIALLLVDVDKFKVVNDTYGHDVGDRVLRRVSETLKHTFRSVDIICRIGGDEFVVIMTRVDSSMRDMVEEKIRHANAVLQREENGLPMTSLSVGAAFADRENPQGDIFKDADTALYHVKEAGRCGCAVYGFIDE